MDTLYCRLITVTGWTWDYIDDHMTIPRVVEMQKYWKENPPVHEMIAAYLGIGDPKKSTASPENIEGAPINDFGGFVAAMTGVPGVAVAPDALKVIQHG